MPINLEMRLVPIFFTKECYSCARRVQFEMMWTNIMYRMLRQFFCKECCFDSEEATEFYMQYVVGPKPNVRPPAQRTIDDIL